MTKPASSPRLSLILTLLVAAQFVIVLDFSRVQIALPTMRTELGISLPTATSKRHSPYDVMDLDGVVYKDKV